VDARETEDVGNLGLGERQREGAVANKSHIIQTDVEFAKQMGRSADGVAPADDGKPVPVNGSVDEREEP
jgi:hypothetical protein